MNEIELLGPAEGSARDEHDGVYRLVMAGWATQVVRAFATLAIAEHLERGPLTAPQIAEQAGTDPALTYRVLRAGVALGFLHFDPTTTAFTGTSRLDILHPDNPLTLKHFAQAVPGPATWLPTVRLPDAVRRGRNYVEETLGSELWQYYADHDEEARVFRAAMSDVSLPLIREAVSIIGEVGGPFVLDVGGANGAFVGQLLLKNTHLNGGVLDLAQAMAGVAEAACQQGLGDRISGIAGDFLEHVPAADIYLLKFILHDWDDDSCRKILSNIRRSMKPNARLFVLEMVISDHVDAPISLSAVLMDVLMLNVFNGRERDLIEFETLLHDAGLAIVATTPLHHPYQLIEAQPC